MQTLITNPIQFGSTSGMGPANPRVRSAKKYSTIRTNPERGGRIMSDECEMFGELMLESLLARRSTTAGQDFRKGSVWVGILLIIAAIAPVTLGAAIFKAQGAPASAAKKSHPFSDPVIGADVTKALDTFRPPDESVTAKVKQAS
jgi:hypothetical protein